MLNLLFVSVTDVVRCCVLISAKFCSHLHSFPDISKERDNLSWMFLIFIKCGYATLFNNNTPTTGIVYAISLQDISDRGPPWISTGYIRLWPSLDFLSVNVNNLLRKILEWLSVFHGFELSFFQSVYHPKLPCHHLTNS